MELHVSVEPGPRLSLAQDQLVDEGDVRAVGRPLHGQVLQVRHT